MIAGWLSTLALVPLILVQGSPPTAKHSLEGLLERARVEHKALMDTIRPALVALIADLESSNRPPPSRLEEIHQSLDQLGREAGLLLLEFLDPGEEPSKEIRFRTREIRKAVIRMRPGGIVGELIRRSQAGSIEGRKYAIELLGFVPEKARAAAHLRRLYRTTNSELRLASIRSIALLGGPRSNAVLQGALEDEDPEVRRTVMKALAAAGQASAAPAILAALGNLERATPMAREIVEFFRQVPTVVDGAVLDALLDLALHLSSDSDACVAVLKALPRFEAVETSRRARELREGIEALITSDSPDVRDGALICAVLLGDRKAKKKLLEPHDLRIRNDPTYYKFYERRGAILLQIDEPADAAKDFRTALELIESDNAPRYHDLWINLARAYARTRKFSRVKTALVDMQMNFDERRMLLADPDFEEFVAIPRYAKIFE